MDSWAPVRSKIPYTPPTAVFAGTLNALRANSLLTPKGPTADLARAIGCPQCEVDAVWNPAEPCNVRRHMFHRTEDGRVFPAFITKAEVYKKVIDAYAAWYRISQDDMCEFWMDIVDCFLSCDGFETCVSSDFRAWVYGRLCRHVLMERQKRTRLRSAEPYDPVSNSAL